MIRSSALDDTERTSGAQLNALDISEGSATLYKAVNPMTSACRAITLECFSARANKPPRDSSASDPVLLNSSCKAEGLKPPLPAAKAPAADRLTALVRRPHCAARCSSLGITCGGKIDDRIPNKRLCKRAAAMSWCIDERSLSCRLK